MKYKFVDELRESCIKVDGIVEGLNIDSYEFLDLFNEFLKGLGGSFIGDAEEHTMVCKVKKVVEE